MTPKYQRGDKIRIKVGIDYSKPFETMYHRNEYYGTRLKAIEGRVRTVANTATSQVDGQEYEVVYIRGFHAIPVDWVEPPTKRTAKKVVEVKDLTENAILGQDKIKKQLKYAVEQNMPALLIGETGTGKTTIVKDIAEGMGKKDQWLRFNLTGETTVDEFVGKYTLENGATKWQDGVLLQAMRKGLWLIVDEINVALPEILFVLHSLLDDDKSVMVAQHDGEVVKPHENFRFFATMNPVEEYAGTKDLNKAFMSRFGMILKIDYPKPEYEKAILIHKAGVTDELADKLIDIAILLRRAKTDGEIFYTCSTRDLIQLGKLTKALPLTDAIQVSVVNKANGDGPKIVEYIRRVVQMYTQAEKEFGTLNIDQITEKIRNLQNEVENKQLELVQAEQNLEHKSELIAQREAELKNKVPEMEKRIRQEIIASLQGA